MRRIFGVLERIAQTPATVLFLGETGTGKDLLARSVHLAWGNGPFEVVDCGAISPTLIESELFGHERGAFTGAVAARAGAFERASGGTIFLDEIGELALDLQPKLLRVLEARHFRRVGGDTMIPADVRVLAGTTKNLRREVQEGRFRDDLYFRLSVVTIQVPPLRRRIDDIPILAKALLASNDPQPLPLPDHAAAALMTYDWPGNVRELRNVLERSLHVTRATGARELRLVDFPPRDEEEGAAGSHGAHEANEFREGETYRETRARFEQAFEKRYVTWLLARHGGNVAAAARGAHMDRNHLTDLARRHGLDRRRRSE
jgi:transcriptional regulator with GAF, ATPase, and Fis domain